MDLQTLAAALAISDKRIAASSPSASSEPPDAPKENDLWVDTGVSPTMMRRWRGADATTEREYIETRVGCGKNLIKPQGNATIGGVTYTIQNDGTYLANGTVTSTNTFRLLEGVLPVGQYTISGGSGGLQVSLAVYNAEGSWIRTICMSHNGASATGAVTGLTGEEAYHAVFIQATSAIVGQTVSNVVLSPQLERGDTATAFEPYEDIPSLALDNAQGQIESVAAEAWCRAKQAGTGAPSPENIRAISGRESVEIAACGKNLVDLSGLYVSTSNVGMGVSGDSVRVYTTGDGGTWRGARTPVFTIHAGVPYALSATLDTYVSGDARIGLRGADDNTFLSGATLPFGNGTGSLSATYTPDADDEVYLSLLCTNDTILSGDCTFSNIQLETGSAATEYEPYRPMGGGTVTPTEPLYGLPGAEDTVDVSVDGDVTATRRTGVFIADGDQYAPYASTFAAPEGVYAYTAPLTGSGAARKENFAGMCSHFTVIPRNAVQSERVAGTVMLGIPNSGDGPQAWFFTTQTTAEAFNAWLQQQDSAGTPVTLVYELAVPETEALTAVAPIAPEPGQVNILTDADALTATVYGSGWDIIGDQTGLLATIAQLAARVAALEQAAVNESTGG